MDDLTAINRLRRGDLSGLAALIERYQLQAVRIAMLITRDRPLAEDVVQTVFLRIGEKIDLVDARRPFAPYLFRSVAHEAVYAAGRAGRHESLESPLRTTNGKHGNAADVGESLIDLLPDPSPTPDAAAEAAELRREVRDALDKLTPEQRAAVVLRYYLDYSEAEMAEALDTAPGTIKWRLHEARKRLRGMLKAKVGS